ncbi:hypothetical protein ACSBR1_028960 [Camellia fascicularis]
MDFLMRWGYEWVCSKEQVIENVDEEGRKIFEAVYGKSLQHTACHHHHPFVTHVIGATDDNDTRTHAEFAVAQYNKNSKKNQPLRFLRVVGAVKVTATDLIETYYLLTFQAMGESIEPGKFFAKVSTYRIFLNEDDHVELEEYTPVDDDLTQLKHPLYKMRREKKRFLKEKEAKLQRGKAMFLGKLRASKVISSVRSWDDQEKILKVISAQLEREMEFKEQNGLIFEEEDAFMSLHEQDHICKSSEHQTQLHGATLAEPPPPAWFAMGAQKPLPWQNSQLP